MSAIPNGPIRRSGDPGGPEALEVARRSAGKREAHHHQRHHPGHLHDGEDVLGERSDLEAEAVEHRERQDGRDGNGFDAAGIEGHEVPEVGGEPHRDGRDRGRVDHHRRAPAVEIPPDRPERPGQVDELPSRLRHRRAELGHRERPEERDHPAHDPGQDARTGRAEAGRDEGRHQKDGRRHDRPDVDHGAVEQAELGPEAVVVPRRLGHGWPGKGMPPRGMPNAGPASAGRPP